MATEITQLILPVSLFCIMIGVGLSLQWRDFQRVLASPRVLLVGLGLQLLMLPLLAVAISELFALPAVLAVGLIIVALAPGGATSNLITLLARGDTALSVSLTAVTSLITPLTLPLATWGLLAWQLPERATGEFPLLATLAKLLFIALLPVLLGMLIRRWAPRFSERMRTPVRILALLFLLLVVISIVRANQQSLAAIVLMVGPAALTLIGCALLLGWGVARRLGYPREQAVTLAIETGIQNAGTALLITGGILQDAQMSASVLCYGVLMNLPVLLLVIWRNCPRGQRA